MLQRLANKLTSNYLPLNKTYNDFPKAIVSTTLHFFFFYYYYFFTVQILASQNHAG